MNHKSGQLRHTPLPCPCNPSPEAVAYDGGVESCLVGAKQVGMLTLMNWRSRLLGVIVLVALGMVLARVFDAYGPAATEQWYPKPAVVNAAVGEPPSDARVLFDGRSLQHWRSRDGEAPAWRIVDGMLVVTPGSGDLISRDIFCDVQLHLEWMVPELGSGSRGQNRSNSGVFLQDRYEIQILDSYQNPTYVNGQAGALYKQASPLVNASRPAGQWQTYDIVFRAPRFGGEALIEPAYITVLHNGVLVQHHTAVKGDTVYWGNPEYTPHGCAPLRLQDHWNPVYFRNIWIRSLTE